MFSFFGNNDDDDNENNNNLRPPERLERMGAYDWGGEDDDGFGPGRFGDENPDVNLDNGEGKKSENSARDANTPYVNLLGLTTSRDGEERRGAKPINIRNLRNEIIPFFVDTSTKVLKLKQMYVNKVGDRMEPTGMMFISKGRRLDDNKTLHHYGIKPGDEIHLVMRLRGGILGGGKKKKRKTRRRRKKRRKSRRKKTRRKRGKGPAFSKTSGMMRRRMELRNEAMEEARKNFLEKYDKYMKEKGDKTGIQPSVEQMNEWVKESRKNVFHPNADYYTEKKYKGMRYTAQKGGKRRRKRKSKKKKRR